MVLNDDGSIVTDGNYFRYQKRCDELEVANGQFKEKYEQLGDEKKEIVSFLKKTLEQRGNFSSHIFDIYF